MTSADNLSLILRRLDEIERKLDRMRGQLSMMEELQTPTAIGYSARRGNRPRKDSASRSYRRLASKEQTSGTNEQNPGQGSKRLSDIGLKVTWKKQRTSTLLPPPQSEEAEFDPLC